jgi:hypothetical protein
MQAKKQAPPVASHSTRQGLRPTLAITNENFGLRGDRVRWPAKTSGAFGFGLSFLVLFLSRKKVRKEVRYIFRVSPGESFYCMSKLRLNRRLLVLQ